MKIFTGLDLETSGLLDPAHRIIELGLIVYNERGERLSSLVKRFNPGRPIDPKAEAVHHITFADVSSCPKLEDEPGTLDLVDRLLMRSEVVFAHNGIGFDFPFMRQEWARIGRTLPVMNEFDTMLEGRWATPLGKLPNLGELCFATRTSYDPDQAHAAEYDIDRMAQCFFYGLKRGFFQPKNITMKVAA